MSINTAVQELVKALECTYSNIKHDIDELKVEIEDFSTIDSSLEIIGRVTLRSKDAGTILRTIQILKEI